jgi:hypothetical protein
MSHMASPPERPQPQGHQLGETSMKKLLIAVALVVSFAAPAMADNFPNVYATHLGR